MKKTALALGSFQQVVKPTLSSIEMSLPTLVVRRLVFMELLQPNWLVMKRRKFYETWRKGEDSSKNFQKVKQKPMFSRLASECLEVYARKN